MSVQALLTDGQGQPLPGDTVNLTFNVYDSGGALVEGPIVMDGVAMQGGIVGVQIPVSPGAFDGTARELGIRVNGEPEASPRIPLTAVPYAYRVHRVAGEELDDEIALGSGPPNTPADGSLSLYNDAAAGSPLGGKTVELKGQNSVLSLYSNGGLLTAQLGRAAYGELKLRDTGDGSANAGTVLLSATADSGGKLVLSNTNGVVRVVADGGAGVVSADGSFNALDPSNGSVRGRLAGGSQGQLALYDGAGVEAVVAGIDATNAGGMVKLNQSGGAVGVALQGDAGNGASIRMYENDGDTSIEMNSQGAGGGAEVTLRNSAASATMILDGDSNDGGVLAVYNNAGTETTTILGGVLGQGALVTLKNGADSATLVLAADATDDGGEVSVRNGTGIQTLLAHGNDGVFRVLEGVEVVDVFGGHTAAHMYKESQNGWLETYASDEELTAKVGGGLDAGGRLLLYDAAGAIRVLADGDDGDGSGAVEIRGDDGNAKVLLDAERTGTDDGGTIEIIGNANSRIRMRGSYEGVGNTGAWMVLRDGGGANADRVELAARDTVTGTGGAISLSNDAGFTTLRMVGDDFGPGTS